MARKRRNAQKPAAAKPETVAQDQPAAGEEQENALVVAGDSGQPAEGQPDEQPANPGPADDGSVGGTEGADVLLDADVPYGEPALDLRAGNVEAAIAAACVAYDQALRIIRLGDRAAWQVREENPELLALSHDDYAEAGRLLREIGHARATTAVVATQLKLSGLRTEALDIPETIALEAFLFTLAGLDGMADALARVVAKELEDRLRKPAPPVPVDETTMETVDDTLATW